MLRITAQDIRYIASMPEHEHMKNCTGHLAFTLTTFNFDTLNMQQCSWSILIIVRGLEAPICDNVIRLDPCFAVAQTGRPAKSEHGKNGIVQ